MFDAIEIEKRGIPTLTIAHDTFEAAANMHAEILGLPQIPLLVEPTPDSSSATVDSKRIVAEKWQQILGALVKVDQRTEDPCT